MAAFICFLIFIYNFVTDIYYFNTNPTTSVPSHHHYFQFTKPPIVYPIADSRLLILYYWL